MNPTGATLAGTTKLNFDSTRTATFDDLLIDKPGTYTLVTYVQRDPSRIYGNVTLPFDVAE